MTYTEQIEQYIDTYPLTAVASVPPWCGVTALPAYPHVMVQQWEEDYCQLEDSGGIEIARFRLVG
jgi:hypothetical protein